MIVALADRSGENVVIMEASAAEKIATALTASQLSYGQVETALGDVYHLDETNISKIRARYKHFQKLGLLGHRPGTGSKPKYGLGEFAKILLVMEISEFGIDPAAIDKMRSSLFSDGLGDINSPISMLVGDIIDFPFPKGDNNQRYLVFAPKAMSSRWMHPDEQIEHWPLTSHYTTVQTATQLPQAIAAAEEAGGGTAISVINLTSLASRAAQALIPHVLELS